MLNAGVTLLMSYSSVTQTLMHCPCIQKLNTWAHQLQKKGFAKQLGLLMQMEQNPRLKLTEYLLLGPTKTGIPNMVLTGSRMPANT